MKQLILLIALQATTFFARADQISELAESLSKGFTWGSGGQPKITSPKDSTEKDVISEFCGKISWYRLAA